MRKDDNYYADKNYDGDYYLGFNRDRKNQDNPQRDDKKGDKKYGANVFHKGKFKKKIALIQ